MQLARLFCWGGGGSTSVLALTAAPAVIAEVFGLGGVGETQSVEEVAGRIAARRADDGRAEVSWQPTSVARASRSAAFEEDSGVLELNRAQKKNAIVVAFFGYGERSEGAFQLAVSVEY